MKSGETQDDEIQKLTKRLENYVEKEFKWNEHVEKELERLRQATNLPRPPGSVKPPPPPP